MGTRALAIQLGLLGVAYVLMDVGLDRSRLLWTLGLCGLMVLWLALAGGVIGGALWGLERAFARRRGRGPVPGLSEFRLYAGIGSGAVFALLMFHLHAYAFG
jgi:hypothetical protein